jgi:hypothetical protein
MERSTAPPPAAPPPAPASPFGPTPLVVKVLAVLGLAVLLIGGGLLVGRLAPGSDEVKIAFIVAWFVIVSFFYGLAAKARPDLKLPLRVAFLVIAVGSLGFYVWDSYLRPKEEANETLTRVAPGPSEAAPEEERGGEPAPPSNVATAEGSFDGVEGHSATGTATVVKLDEGDGQKLQFEDFEVTQGPDLRVYLSTPDAPTSGDAGDFKDLGGLKGEKGQFEYDIAGIDTDKYSKVVVWCRAFGVAFGEAPLEKKS